MKNKIIIIWICLLIAVGIFYWFHPMQPTVMINGSTFYVELAVTQSEIEKGLGGRDSLLPNHGMLFIRDHKDQYPFWMGGMKFPLDFIWIDGNVIVDISKNIPVLENGKIPQLKPSKPVDKILEINAGETDKAGIKIGDTLLFNK